MEEERGSLLACGYSHLALLSGSSGPLTSGQQARLYLSPLTTVPGRRGLQRGAWAFRVLGLSLALCIALPLSVPCSFTHEAPFPSSLPSWGLPFCYNSVLLLLSSVHAVPSMSTCSFEIVFYFKFIPFSSVFLFSLLHGWHRSPPTHTHTTHPATMVNQQHLLSNFSLKMPLF